MQCSHKKRDGKRCRASALTDNANCSLHAQPGRAAELGSKGGRRRAIHNSGDLREFAAPKTAADLRELLAESIVEIRAGKLDPRIANALGYLGASYLRALEVSDIESRLDAIETMQRKEKRLVFSGSENGSGES